jgi:hypothetical protein
MGLFGPEWEKPEPPVKEKRQPKPRKRPICPDWIAELLACENCGRARVSGTGNIRGAVAACVMPGCAKLVPRAMVNKSIADTLADRVGEPPEKKELARCLRIAWQYLRGKRRRKGESC